MRMSRTNLPLHLERELEDIQRHLAERQPDLAERLELAVDALRDEVSEPGGYMSTGEAAAALGVSPNTVKKWVRLGLIRDFWTLPRSGYVKIARSEVQRIRQEGAPRIMEGPP
jgi:Mn-dependent DtxR family transcriptional regulator